LGSILWLFHLPFIKLTIIGQVKQITKWIWLWISNTTQIIYH
jgi:hypothetical protein